MKGCLKLSSSAPNTGLDPSHVRKCVAFGVEGSEEVYYADEWDRTPTEPARRLSYQDLLELKEIQRSLPRANQLPDLVSGRPGSHYLSAVPIGLLPLLTETDSQDSENSSTASSPAPSPLSTPLGAPSYSNWVPLSMRPPPVNRPRPSVPSWHPPHLAHLLPGKPVVERQKPKFAFLPLLDTPPTSASSSPYPSSPSSRCVSPEPQSDTDQSLDPPTPSLTNASLESSPYSRASSPVLDPPYFHLPPPRERVLNVDGYPFKPTIGQQDSYFPPYACKNSGGIHASSSVGAFKPEGVSSLSPPPSSPRPLSRGSPARDVSPQRNINFAVTPKPTRRRNFIVVNDIEIDLDSDDDEECFTPPPSPRPPSLPFLDTAAKTSTSPLTPLSIPLSCCPPPSPPLSPLEGEGLPIARQEPELLSPSFSLTTPIQGNEKARNPNPLLAPFGPVHQRGHRSSSPGLA